MFSTEIEAKTTPRRIYGITHLEGVRELPFLNLLSKTILVDPPDITYENLLSHLTVEIFLPTTTKKGLAQLTHTHTMNYSANRRGKQLIR